MEPKIIRTDEPTEKLDTTEQVKKVDWLSFYVAPHTKKSREVIEADIPRILDLHQTMTKLCYTPRGNHQGAFAIAHSQIDDKDPLAFLVNMYGDIVVNPRIVNQTKWKKEKGEGCMSFPDKPYIGVLRSNKVELECQTIIDGKLTEKKVITLKGLQAQVAQHECDHINGILIHNL